MNAAFLSATWKVHTATQIESELSKNIVRKKSHIHQHKQCGLRKTPTKCLTRRSDSHEPADVRRTQLWWEENERATEEESPNSMCFIRPNYTRLFNCLSAPLLYPRSHHKFLSSCIETGGGCSEGLKTGEQNRERTVGVSKRPEASEMSVYFSCLCSGTGEPRRCCITFNLSI